MEIADIMAGTNYDQSSLQGAGDNMGKDDFMTLLVTQLQNQDPFKPLDNAEFVAQLAQFSSLEQSQNTNDRIAELSELEAKSYELMSLVEGSSLIGKMVTFYNEEAGMPLTGPVEALEIINGSVTLNVGGLTVALSEILEVSAPPVL